MATKVAHPIDELDDPAIMYYTETSASTPISPLFKKVLFSSKARTAGSDEDILNNTTNSSSGPND